MRTWSLLLPASSALWAGACIEGSPTSRTFALGAVILHAVQFLLQFVDPGFRFSSCVCFGLRLFRASEALPGFGIEDSQLAIPFNDNPKPKPARDAPVLVVLIAPTPITLSSQEKQSLLQHLAGHICHNVLFHPEGRVTDRFAVHVALLPCSE